MEINLNPSYLFADRAPPEFHATVEAHGLYNTQQFVLRLSPLIHRKLSELEPGISTNGIIGFDGAQAMSTFLHETMHWWQHIGSTYGFILSLNYPVQSHATHLDLQSLLQQDGFKKSIVKQAEYLNIVGSPEPDKPAGIANRIINNHFDMLAFRAFTLGPDAAKQVVQEKLFEAVGHAFHMTYAHTVNQLGSTVDPEFKKLPHPKEWQEGFRDLVARKVEGHFYGSSVELWPLGSHEIFEGQARFSQIQYLSHACGHRLSWDDYLSIGMLSGIYVRAFEEFLRLTESKWPDRVDDPIVGLFLLVCDLAINPGSGFPFHVSPNFETFVEDVNPGARFCMFSRIVVWKGLATKAAVRDFSKTEYEALSAELCQTAKERTPLEIAKTFAKSFAPSGAWANLREEYESYSFGPANYALRHLFAHFLAFQEDKAQRPEFFCWPGAWLAGERVTSDAQVLFDKHGALFVDKEDHDGIFARTQRWRNEEAVQKTFETFYHNTVIYDLTNQWISKDGPFSYDLTWLQPDASTEDMKDYLRKKFHMVFGVDTEAVELLS